MKEQYLINANKSYVWDNYDTVISLWKKINKSGLEQKFQQKNYSKTSLIHTWLILYTT